MEGSGRARTVKVVVLFALLISFFLLFGVATTKIALSDRKLPTLYTSSIESAIRGAIYSSDGFTLASSKKLYKAVMNTYNLDPGKKELFVTLFSTYSGIDKDELYDKLKRKGNIVLSYNIDEKAAVNLKKLSYKLLRYGVFRDHEDESGRVFNYGLSIIESGEKREYTYKDTLEPVLGYVRKYEDSKITKVEGVKGLEKYYQYNLSPVQDMYVRGERDLGFDIILNGDSIVKRRIDGQNLHLNISLKLQKKIERVLDEFKKRLNAEEIVVGLMDSDSGKMLAAATTNRFNPNKILTRDYPNLNSKMLEYPIEPGSVIKPIIFSLLLEHRLVNPYENIFLEDGRYRLGKNVITDSHELGRAIAEDVIIYSSNIGMAKLSQRLSASNYHQGLLKFGFSQPSGIDLPYEKNGNIPPVTRLQNEVYKATVSYGYGFQATFMQMLKAFNIFNNAGNAISPKIGSYFNSRSSQKVYLTKSEPREVISPATADIVNKMLQKTVNEGTGVGAKVPGLNIGGKTGTAHIAVAGKYEDIYNSSFFGFANGLENKFTIGVMVYNLDSKGEYFASRTAVPIFKSIIELLVDEGMLRRFVSKTPEGES
ncbi:MAG: peptidoglycan D,D-transpeptidase FtsI family protein [Campylobacterales bacterium]